MQQPDLIPGWQNLTRTWKMREHKLQQQVIDMDWTSVDPLADFKPQPKKKYRADFMSMELHFPDEPRDYNITLVCPLCRARDCKLVYECTSGPEDPWAKQHIFHIRCKGNDCYHEGPRFDNSTDALQNWRLHAALTE